MLINNYTFYKNLYKECVGFDIYTIYKIRDYEKSETLERHLVLAKTKKHAHHHSSRGNYKSKNGQNMMV
jgi:hypothetical protein